MPYTSSRTRAAAGWAPSCHRSPRPPCGIQPSGVKAREAQSLSSSPSAAGGGCCRPWRGTNARLGRGGAVGKGKALVEPRPPSGLNPRAPAALRAQPQAPARHPGSAAAAGGAVALQQRRGGSGGAEAGRQRLQEVKKPPGAAGGAGGCPAGGRRGLGLGPSTAGTPVSQLPGMPGQRGKSRRCFLP